MPMMHAKHHVYICQNTVPDLWPFVNYQKVGNLSTVIYLLSFPDLIEYLWNQK